MINSVYKTGSVTATGVIATLGLEDCQVPAGVLVGGTFVGTVLIEVSFDTEAAVPTWVPFGSAVTAPGTVKIDIPVKAARARCSAYTSGTIVAGVSAFVGGI